MKAPNLFLGFLAVLSAASGCATTKAATPVERPALEVPPPPPRVIVPMAIETPLPEPVGELPPNPSTSSPARPRPQKDRTETAKPQDPKIETPPPVADPAPVAPPTAPQTAPQLRIPEQGNGTQVAGQIRDTIARSRWILEKTDYGQLNNLRKKAYDEARLFAKEAEDALNTKNLVYAKELADKAERLAKELQNR